MALTTRTKVVKIFETLILDKVENFKALLLNGDLSKLEEELHKLLIELYNEIMSHLLNEVGRSVALKEKLKAVGLSLGLSNLKLRKNRLQISTGYWVSYESYYAHQVNKQGVSVNRQLSHVYWGCLDRASPKYVSIVSMMSVVSPSFDVAELVLKQHNIWCNYSRMRRLSLSAGKFGQELGIEAQLDKGEDLIAKRVVVQIDGGRSRMRENKAQYTKKGFQKYDTPWREPKLIVIHVLDEKGQVARKIAKPIYQVSIQDAAECMKDLVQTLKLLKINRAKEIQFVADGASFIWKRIRKAFTSAGVKASQVTYTLDYYHAVEHLKELSELLPWSKTQRQKQFLEWKSWLWEGLANSIARDFKKIMRQAKITLNNTMKTACEYFKKHHDRMQYKRFKRRKLLCGSGLVESAIRRVINLRFKGPSTFWSKNNLDKMYLLRCALLSKRWHNLMNAIELKIKTEGTF